MGPLDGSSMLGDGGATQLVLGDGAQLTVPNQIVADVHARHKNPLVDQQVFSKLERNKFFEVQPSVVYYGGFLVDHVHEQVVHVVNISSVTKRIHILPCDTPFFRVHTRKKGKVAPGMSEELVIHFTPNEWRYYYDTIRIHSDDDNLVIPLHAYPTVAPKSGPKMMARTLPKEQPEFFPVKVDMGRNCPLARTTHKSVPIICNVPVDFEFSINVLTPHPDMELEPLEGSVPGEGRAMVDFYYTPSRMATAEMIIEVSISQFGFKPIICRVVGSAGAGTIREETMNEITNTLIETGVVGQNFNLENYSKPKQAAGNIDLTVVHDEAKGFKDKIDQMRASRKPGEPIHIHHAKPREKERDTFQRGYQLPANLRPRAATQFVLNQVKGKLGWSELKRQMEESGHIAEGDEEEMDPKAKANRSIKWYETVRMQPGRFVDIEEDYGEGQTRQICEYRYGFELKMRDEYDKAKEVKWFPAIGDDPPSKEEVEQVKEMRLQREVEAARRWRQGQCEIKANVCDPAKSVAHPLGGLPDHVPTFDPYLNDAWSTRKEITERFRQEVHKLIIRQRVARRLAAISAKLELVGGGGANTQVVDAIMSAESSGPAAPGGDDKAKLSNIEVEKCVTHTFPLYRDGNFRDRLPVKTDEIERFEDWDFVDLKVPQTYRLMGYQRQVLPPIRTYVPLEGKRRMREGAEEEAGVRCSRGPPDAVPTSQIQRMPECFTVLPEEKVPLCRAMDPKNRPTEGRDRCIIYKDVAVHETHPEWALRPYERKVGDAALARETTLPTETRQMRLEDALFGQVKEGQLVPEPEAPGLNSMRTLGNTPMISGRWLSRKELPDVVVAPMPMMMVGPDPSDEQSEDEADEVPADSNAAAAAAGGEGEEEDEKELPIVIPPPTAEYVKANFKLPSRVPKKEVAEGEGEGEGGEAPAAAEDGEGEGEDEAKRRAELEEEEAPIPLNSRAMHEREMEEEFTKLRRGLEVRLPSLISSLNEAIHDPRKKIALEPSIFPVPELDWVTERKPPT